MPNRIVIKQGERYGRLTVVQEIDSILNAQNKKVRIFNCVCDCGNHKIVRYSNLKNGNVQSCGCLFTDVQRSNKLKHGDLSHNKRSREYITWANMKARCYNPSNNRYNLYGGRGIEVCERWINSYENFLEDMGRKPTPKHSIERINVNGNYEPLNCKWATDSEQMKNRRPFKKNIR